MSKIALLGGIALVVGLAPALAQEMGHGAKMAPPSTRAEVEARVKDHFTKLDANADGAVTAEERRAAHEKIMAAMQDKHFTMLDANKDGSISRSEFDAGHKAMKDKMAMHRGAPGAEGAMGGQRQGRGHAMMMRHGMRGADANKDAKITLAEMTARALEHFDRVDANKDGTITGEERKAAHQAMREKHKAMKR